MHNLQDVRQHMSNQEGFSDIIAETSELFFKMLFRRAQDPRRFCKGVAVAKTTFVDEQRRLMTPGVALPSDALLSRRGLFVELKSLLLL